MLTSPPTVSIIMSVYNGEPYLSKAIDSILTQTYTNFEFIIIDDGSTDKSAEIISQYSDSRIRLISNDGNQGLVFSLNLGLKLAQGAFIARMDADDISLPERLMSQIEFMQQNPKVIVCGTWIECMGNSSQKLKFPTTHKEMSQYFVFRPPLAHPTVMMRGDIFKTKTPVRYDNTYKHVEDYKLWLDLMSHGEFANIPKILYYYRIYDEQITALYSGDSLNGGKRIRRKFINKLFKESASNLIIPDTIDLDSITQLHQEKLSACDENTKKMIIYCYRLSLSHYSLKSFFSFLVSMEYFHYPYTVKRFLRVVLNYTKKKAGPLL